jgi:hypothetical protein
MGCKRPSQAAPRKTPYFERMLENPGLQVTQNQGIAQVKANRGRMDLTEI